jgi:thioredoxin reductase (NADPH)
MQKFLVLLLFAMTLYQNLAATEKSDPKIIPITTQAPQENKIYPVAIIGAGAAGTMAVKRAVLNNNEVLLFTGAKQERRRSRGNWVRKVDNIPGLARYERTILELRNEALQQLFQSPLSHNLYVIETSVTSMEKGAACFKLVDGTGRSYLAKYVVMATGIMDEQPHIQGSIDPILAYANGQTVAYCCLCDGHRSFGKKSVVIGHSESAANTALLLLDKYQLSSMAILTNGQMPEFSSALSQQLYGKNIRILSSPIREVLGNREQKQLTGFLLEDGHAVEAELGFVALGIRPNNQLALQLGAEVDASGLVVTDSHGESTVPNLFIVGDLRASSLKQIYTAWQHAVDSIQLINRRLRVE